MIDKNDLRAIVQDDYARGDEALKGIRNDFKREDKIFHDQRKDKETITDYSFYVVHSAFMARTYADKVQASFIPTQPGIGKGVVDNLNKVYQHDMLQDDWEKINYQKNYDKYKYGVGIVAKVGWDGETKKNIWSVIDPKTVIADPDGDYITDEYSFLGFSTYLTAEQIPNNWENVNRLNPHKVSLDEDGMIDDAKRNAGINHTSSGDAELYHVYYHFNYVDGRLCMSTWGNDRKELLYKEYIEGVFPEEKKDPSRLKISDLIACDRWRPMRESFFGHRLAKFAGNIQEQKALIASLRYKKSKAELYPMYMYNSRLIQNREDLDFGFNKFVAINALEGEDIGNAMKPVQKDFRSDHSRIIEAELDDQLTRVTGGMNGDLIQGNETERRETLGTNKLVQGNADINLELTTHISMWFERQIAKNWLRGYLENFESGDEKVAKLTTVGGTEYIAFKKKDFLAIVKVDISVVSDLMKKKEDNEKRIALTQVQSLLGTVELPSVSRMEMLRDIAEKTGLPRDEVILRIPFTPEETKAMLENTILSTEEYLNIKDTDEHLTHIIVHQMGGVDTLELEAHVQAHLKAYTATKKPQEQQPGMSAPDENAQNLQASMTGQQLAQMDAVNNGGLGVRQ